MSIRRLQVKEALNYLQLARQAATMETMRVLPPTGEFDSFKVDEWNRQVRETTRLYRETWIISIIDEAVRLLTEELDR